MLPADERGLISIRGVFWLGFLGFALYSGYLIGIPYATYTMLKYEVEFQAENAHYHKDDEIRGNIFEKARYWKIPIKEEDINIERRVYENEIEISISYEVELNLFDRYKRQLYYDIDVLKPLSEEALK